MKFSLLSLSIFLVATTRGAVAQTASCPPGNLVSEFGPPLEGCLLCVPVVPGMESCRASCSCSNTSCSGPTDPTCTTTPEGCGNVVCPGDEPSPTPPTPSPPTSAPVPSGGTTPTPPTNDPECGIDVSVDCVLYDQQDVKCEDYVPTCASECNRMVWYSYFGGQTSPPVNAVLTHIHRYREGSYWEDEHGNPRKYREDKYGENLTPSLGWYWNMQASEGENVNFCAAGSVDTTFEFATNGGDLNRACVVSETYTLTTQDITGLDACLSQASDETPASEEAPQEALIESVVEIKAASSDAKEKGDDTSTPKKEGDGTSTMSSASINAILIPFVAITFGGMFVW